jgi:predicted NBD/HSP70 family sugar kinase
MSNMDGGRANETGRGSATRGLTLKLLQEEGPLSRAEIARRLRLSRPTASRIVDALEQEGLIARVGKSQPTGGRLGDLYQFRDEAGLVLGLDLGTREARLALGNLNGEILKRAARTLSLEDHEQVLPELRRLVLETLERFGVPFAKLRALGVAVPGVVRQVPEGGYVDSANVFRGLNDRPLKRELVQDFGLPVVMDNDVNFAALGECQSGSGQGSRHLAYLFVGRGIGAGLVLDGKLYRGSNGGAGEVGSMLIDRTALQQQPGRRGNLETEAGIDRLLAALPASARSSASLAEVGRYALQGEPRVCQALNIINDYLAAALVNLVAVIDPETIVLGGDLSELPEVERLCLRPIERLVQRHVGRPIELHISTLQGDAALCGALQAAAVLALEAEK